MSESGGKNTEGGQPFIASEYNKENDFPVLPDGALSKEGRICGLMPGFWKYVDDNTVIMDTASRRVMIDRSDVIPEGQYPGQRMAAMRIIVQQAGGRAIDGYVVDVRKKLPAKQDRLTSDGEYKSEDVRRRYDPQPVLGMIVMNKMTDQEEYYGIPEAEKAAYQLKEAVDYFRTKGSYDVPLDRNPPLPAPKQQEEISQQNVSDATPEPEADTE